MRLLFLLFILGMTACGKDDGGSSSSATELEGTWASDCTDIGDGYYAIMTRVHSGSARTSTSRLFSDANCAKPMLQYDYEQSFKIGDALADGIKKIDITMSKASFTALSPATVAEAKQGKYFGYSDWKKDEPRDIAGKAMTTDDEAEDKVGSVFYTIFKIKDGRLYGGNTSSGSGTSEVNRPTEIDTSYSFKKN